MASLSQVQVESVLNIMERIGDIDPGVLMMQNLTVSDASGTLVGDICWNADTDNFEWVQA